MQDEKLRRMTQGTKFQTSTNLVAYMLMEAEREYIARMGALTPLGMRVVEEVVGRAIQHKLKLGSFEDVFDPTVLPLMLGR